MLDVAKKKFPSAKFQKMDMIKLKLPKKYDVIVSLFSSIRYVKTHANLRKTLNAFSKHLKAGGVLIIEPWFAPNAYQPGNPHGLLYKNKDIVIARATVSTRKGTISIMDMHHLISERGKGTKHIVERHEIGLFSVEKTLQYLKQAGLVAKYYKNGLLPDRGLYIAVKK